MRIGIDFDNTIVSYDALFHKVARERGLVPSDMPVNKVAVRDHLRRTGKEELWTEMQGYVYGARMDEATAYPGVIDFLIQAVAAGHELAIVSHKTKHPFLGPQYDLHQAARGWVEKHLCRDGKALIPPSQVFFELTKEKKLARVESFGCDVFIDDLPEILQAKTFPATTRRVLFDPERNHSEMDLLPIHLVHSWYEFSQYLAMPDSPHEASAAVATLLASMGKAAPIQSIETCSMGGNNRTYKIKTAEKTFIAKQYFRHPGDTRDRLAAEFAFVAYAEKAAPGLTPRPLVSNAATGFALYEFVEGGPFRPGDVTAKDVDYAAEFFCALNSAQARRSADLPLASEACFSIREHIDMIDSRLDRLTAMEPQDDEDRSAKPFIDELHARWRSLATEIEAEVRDAGFDLHQLLAENQRCISPSDFGFHNALREGNGAIRFLDFEYAGWDDPAKMAGDFFAQLAVPVPAAYFERFVEKTMAPFPGSDSLIRRAELLRPLYQIKWCCIALNVFLPVHLARRKFANSALDTAALKRVQIDKAKNILQSLQSISHVLH